MASSYSSIATRNARSTQRNNTQTKPDVKRMNPYFSVFYGRYWTFKGRSSRQDLFALIISFGIVAVAATGAAGYLARHTDVSEDPLFLFLIVLGEFLFFLFMRISSIPICVRRLHDMNLPGWIMAIVFFLCLIPFIGWIVNLAFIIVMLFVDGTHGPNRYGEDPLGRPPKNRRIQA